MKHVFLKISFVVALVALSLTAVAAKANFSGTWVLDKSKSEGLPPDVDQVMTVVQTEDKINLETKVKSDQGEQTISDSYTLNGVEGDFTPRGIGGATGKGKRTAKWSADGNGIEVKEQAIFDTPDGEVKVQINRKWMLSADGKTLVIELDVQGPNGPQLVKRTFTKK